MTTSIGIHAENIGSCSAGLSGDGSPTISTITASKRMSRVSGRPPRSRGAEWASSGGEWTSGRGGPVTTGGGMTGTGRRSGSTCRSRGGSVSCRSILARTGVSSRATCGTAGCASGPIGTRVSDRATVRRSRWCFTTRSPIDRGSSLTMTGRSHKWWGGGVRTTSKGKSTHSGCARNLCSTICPTRNSRAGDCWGLWTARTCARGSWIRVRTVSAMTCASYVDGRTRSCRCSNGGSGRGRTTRVGSAREITKASCVGSLLVGFP